jgi:hypothetical protein
MTIHPHKGAGKIVFGMTRTEVEQSVGRPPRRRTKLSDFDRSEIDFFDGFAVYYDAMDLCSAIEFTRDARVSYDGYELFAHPAHEARAWARSRDQHLNEKDGFFSTALGLSMYAPYIDEPDLDDDERAEPAQSFLAFRPGAYEEERKRLEATTMPIADLKDGKDV